MKKACLYVHNVYKNNEIFNPASPLNRDNCLEFFHELKKQAFLNGIDLQTQDHCSQEEAGFIIFNEMPKNIQIVKYPDKSAVFLFESELIRPQDWNLENHQFFKTIFTWNDDYIQKNKYVKFNFAHSGRVQFKKFAEKKKLCTLVAGNKLVRHPLELYSKRVEAIRWFEKNHPRDFDFYGMGWDVRHFKMPVIAKYLNRIKPIGKIFRQEWPSYGGPVQNKIEKMKDYKFSICYENARDIKGYITEKILDSMAAGCIPVYWGAPNIKEYIPSDCFIDRTQFKSYEELYSFMTEMSEIEYNLRLGCISNYLNSEAHKAFEPAFNAKIVVERLTNGPIF